MRSLLLIAFSLTFLTVASYAQPQEEDTLDEILCEMTDDPENKTVRHYKEFCTRLEPLFPPPADRENLEFNEKFFLNQMHNLLKRGKKWDQMSTKARADMEESSIKYVKKYLKYEEGDKLKYPDEYQLAGMYGKPCKLNDLNYSQEFRCHEDANYLVLSKITDPKISKHKKLWHVLVYTTRLLDCDNRTYE